MKNLIAINQDPDSYQAKCILNCVTDLPRIITEIVLILHYQIERLQNNNREPGIWVTEHKGDPIITIINWTDHKRDAYPLTLSMLSEVTSSTASYRIHDLLEEEEGGKFLADINAEKPFIVKGIPAHGVRIYRFEQIGLDAMLI